MLLQAPSACSVRRFATTVQLPSLSVLLSVERPLRSAASRQMEVLAAAEATSPELDGARLDKALPLLFPGRWNSSSALKRTVRRGEVLVNGVGTKTDATLQLGDKVQVVIQVGSSAAARQFGKKVQQEQQLPGLDVAFEDDHMAVVVKPQGLLSQGPKGAASVAGRIKYCLNYTPLPGAMASPVIVHRLDVGTGGLMLVAKTRTAATKMSQDLAEHNMQKRYLALVIGRLKGSGIIEHPVGGYPAVSLFKVEGHRASASFGCLTVVSLWPKTGRTHQLRKHMAYIGHPILGDLQYKHHRKPDCKAVLTDISSWLPLAKTSTQRLQSQPATNTHEQQAGAAKQQTGCQPHQQQQQQQQHGNQLPSHQLDQSQARKGAPIQADTRQQEGGSSTGGSSTDLQCNQGTDASVKQDNYYKVVAQLGEPDLPLYSGMGSHHSAQASMATLRTSLNGVAAAGAAGDDGGDEDEDEGIETAAAASCRQRGQVLRDGSVVGTCLWAVQLRLMHPCTDVHLDISVDEAPARLYEKVCECDAVTP